MLCDPLKAEVFRLDHNSETPEFERKERGVKGRFPERDQKEEMLRSRVG